MEVRDPIHGAIAVGADLDEALYRMELGELSAYAALLANLRSIYRSEDAAELEQAHGEVVRASRTLSLPPGTDRSARARFFAQPALVDAMRTSNGRIMVKPTPTA